MSKKVSIYHKLISNFKNKPVSFHVPGHKYGNGFNPHGKKSFENILRLDVTEIPGFDDLHQPKGIIMDAEERAAKFFKADKTFFLVNGSTSGNLAMILSTCQPGDKIIVQRNVHKSVINAIFLAKAVPIYLYPEVLENLMIPGSIKIEDLRNALEDNLDTKAVFLMNPNYYGLGINLEEIANLVHQYKIPLLVDEAHGAHFGLHPKFPKSAIASGADMAVQSTHKTLSAMTMGSMLHIKSNYIDIDRVRLFLSMVQTSSPSYPIMASLDLTVEWLESEGASIWDKQLNAIDLFYSNLKGLASLSAHHLVKKRYLVDPLKVIIQSKDQKISGFLLQELLIEKEVYMELADVTNVLGIVTLGTNEGDLQRLVKALIDIDNHISESQIDVKKTSSEHINHMLRYINNRVKKGTNHSLEKILYNKHRRITIEDSVGMVSAEMVIPYPPGIPIIQPGEIITKDTVDYILLLKEEGYDFQGIKDLTLKTIMVLDEVK